MASQKNLKRYLVKPREVIYSFPKIGLTLLNQRMMTNNPILTLNMELSEFSL
jgi:hypothetical protein